LQTAWYFFCLACLLKMSRLHCWSIFDNKLS
jgi:hypothetical protein